MDKIDLKRLQHPLYAPSAKAICEVDVPALQFLMMDGQGDPNESDQYSQAVEALYAVSYAVKFALKKAQILDYVVMPLEGLWWADDHASFSRNQRGEWKWTMMIQQPVQATATVVQSAINTAREKKGLAALEQLRLESFTEGRCAQTLHIGPFSDEGPTIQRLHAFIEGRSALRGKHHEIYLSDVRRAAPEKWRTILRQPMD